MELPANVLCPFCNSYSIIIKKSDVKKESLIFECNFCNEQFELRRIKVSEIIP